MKLHTRFPETVTISRSKIDTKKDPRFRSTQRKSYFFFILSSDEKTYYRFSTNHVSRQRRCLEIREYEAENFVKTLPDQIQGIRWCWLAFLSEIDNQVFPRMCGKATRSTGGKWRRIREGDVGKTKFFLPEAMGFSQGEVIDNLSFDWGNTNHLDVLPKRQILILFDEEYHKECHVSKQGPMDNLCSESCGWFTRRGPRSWTLTIVTHHGKSYERKKTQSQGFLVTTRSYFIQGKHKTTLVAGRVHSSATEHSSGMSITTRRKRMLQGIFKSSAGK